MLLNRYMISIVFEPTATGYMIIQPSIVRRTYIEPREWCVKGASCTTVIMTHSTVMDAKVTHIRVRHGPSMMRHVGASKVRIQLFKVRQWVRHVHKWCVIILFHRIVDLLKWCVTFYDVCVMLPKCTTLFGTLTHHSRGSIGASYK